jgi:Recombination directionality factor-like
MSPIVDIQRQLVELGRIRTGDQVEFQDGSGTTKRRPRKLETFRLTSASRELVAAAAALYGGEPRAWGDQWEVVVTAESIPVMLPPGQALSQWYELWSGGGCQRRCDGARQVLVDEPCVCPPDKAERAQLASRGAACKPTTRVNLILPELPGLGVWRIESHGYYAAMELAGAAEYLSMATSVGHRIPARLRLVKRQVKRPTIGKDGKATVQTRNFAVPTIDLEVRIADLLAGEIPAPPAPSVAPALPSGPVNRRERVARPALPSGTPLPEEAQLVREVRPELPPPPPIEEAPVVGQVVEAPAGPGLSASALATLARGAFKTKGALADALNSIGHPVASSLEVTAAVTSLTDAERGRLATELNLDWRGPA